MSTVLIVNPRASRVTEQLIAAVAEALRPDDVLRTERGGHATELAASVEGTDRIFV